MAFSVSQMPGAIWELLISSNSLLLQAKKQPGLLLTLRTITRLFLISALNLPAQWVWWSSSPLMALESSRSSRKSSLKTFSRFLIDAHFSGQVIYSAFPALFASPFKCSSHWASLFCPQEIPPLTLVRGRAEVRVPPTGLVSP